MSPRRILLLLFLIFVLFSLLVEEVEGRKRVRRKRRRGRGKQGQPGARRIRHAAGKRAEFVRRRLRKAQPERREAQLRLVDGRADWEGNVQIYHEGRWGNICDDEWDTREGEIVCRTLGFPGLQKVTYTGLYGHVKDRYWMDNLFCVGTEESLTDCRFDGWGVHDCQNDESAGVVCQSHFATTPGTPTLPPRDEPIIVNKTKLGVSGSSTPGTPTLPPRDEPIIVNKTKLGGPLITVKRLTGSGSSKPSDPLQPYSSTPGTQPRRQLVQDGLQGPCGGHCRLAPMGLIVPGTGAICKATGYFGGNKSEIVISGVKCTGNEESLDQCLHDRVGDVFCPDPAPDPNIAGVTCVGKMADLVPDHIELSRSAHLEDKQLFFLQCAMEENCLAGSASKVQDSGYGWHLETRRLLRFTARIVNQGDEAFRPFLPKQYWIWHACHMHYHSMEVFAHYDIIDASGSRIAEGHKASFCLEDNNCLPGVSPVFKCANYGDQGISPGCTDTYAYNIDCQWIDITDVKPGTYTFKLAINPEFKVAEKNFDNNAAYCELIYGSQNVWLGNCTLGRP
nr:lysyl oxidase homolog 3-like [Cherax quadricarinatus]